MNIVHVRTELIANLIKREVIEYMICKVCLIFHLFISKVELVFDGKILLIELVHLMIN